MGWLNPILAVLLALLVPALLSIVILYWSAPTLAGLPKDGSGFTVADHAVFVLAALSASFLVSWILAPFAVLLLRIAALKGCAGWGISVIASLGLGLPVVHFALMGDLTTEDTTLLPHIITAITLLGLIVWGAFWGLVLLRSKRNQSEVF